MIENKEPQLIVQGGVSHESAVDVIQTAITLQIDGEGQSMLFTDDQCMDLIDLILAGVKLTREIRASAQRRKIKLVTDELREKTPGR
ncbi:MAG: hypothetical protein DRJ03_03330 [Chloroflexi bacterium]|nr:MAG: hypothetical protein DRJ03_03330 [Chloroflexota bacterium]